MDNLFTREHYTEGERALDIWRLDLNPGSSSVRRAVQPLALTLMVLGACPCSLAEALY